MNNGNKMQSQNGILEEINNVEPTKNCTIPSVNNNLQSNMQNKSNATRNNPCNEAISNVNNLYSTTINTAHIHEGQQQKLNSRFELGKQVLHLNPAFLKENITDGTFMNPHFMK
jgi:hypothetical protein